MARRKTHVFKVEIHTRPRTLWPFGSGPGCRDFYSRKITICKIDVNVILVSGTGWKKCRWPCSERSLWCTGKVRRDFLTLLKSYLTCYFYSQWNDVSRDSQSKLYVPERDLTASFPSHSAFSRFVKDEIHNFKNPDWNMSETVQCFWRQDSGYVLQFWLFAPQKSDLKIRITTLISESWLFCQEFRLFAGFWFLFSD